MLLPTPRAMTHKVDGLHGQVVIMESGGVDMVTTYIATHIFMLHYIVT